jgi:hypothetical protein
MDWSDKRPINELRFGVEWKPTLGELQTKQPGYGAVDAPFGLREGDPPGAEVLITWNETHANDRARMLTLLKTCNCNVGEDIINLGCTGARAAGLTIDDIKFLRMGLGGSGVGLPCFVSPDSYCLAHEVTGGLQEGQEQRHADTAKWISRDLAPNEAAQRELLDHARAAQGADREAATADVLAGRKLPEGWERERELSTESRERLDAGLADAQAGRVAPIPLSVLAESVWKCPEHTETRWECRYCVAQAIVEGDLLPEYLVGTESLDGPSQAGSVDDVDAHDLGAFIEKKSVEGCAQLDVHVLVARYTRKLSR